MGKQSVLADPKAGFSRFYRDLYNDDRRKGTNSPYKWQTRLAVELAAGDVPDNLVAPTGAGKTTLIEAFLYALAWQVRHGDGRTLPLRLFWVVDRRSVVDQVYRHAERVAQRIDEGNSGSLEEVRSTLRELHVAESPDLHLPAIDCHRWRGGSGLRATTLPPDRAAVVCSTVDQVGSRLLFRGYGVSRGARPVEAALVGTDSLVVIDEAHIAGPFTETAAAVAAVQRSAPKHLGRPLMTLRMSATLSDDKGGEDRETFRLTDKELAEPRLARAVNAEKLVAVGRPARTRVGGLIDAARKFAQQPGVVGVIANTVEEARRVYTELSKEYATLLLIGPNRSIPRDGLIETIPNRSERDGNETDRIAGPKFVVATQTIEVGVDLDFDALVTACAPLDSLAQRLGRLDRAGTVGKTCAVVVHSREPCPVYGETTAQAWALLREWAEDGQVDLGPKRITELLADLPEGKREEVTSGAKVAPLLAPWDIEALSRTSADPVPSPEIEVFLHGDQTVSIPEVNVVWRADLHDPDPDDNMGRATNWAERIRVRPPHSSESISLPIFTVRNWLRRSPRHVEPDSLTADIESVSSAPAETRRLTNGSLPFVLVTADQRGRQVEARKLESLREIAPGSTIVVPQHYGGCDKYGWIPGTSAGRSRRSLGAIDDLGDMDPGQPRLLFDPRLPAGRETAREELAKATREVQLELEEVFEVATKLEMFKRLREPVLAWASAIWGREDVDSPQPHETSRRRFETYKAISKALGGTVRFILDGQAQYDPSHAPAFVLVPDVAHGLSRPRRRVGLKQHSERVANRSRQLAEAATDDPAISRAVEIAGRYHDCGKLDPRFQRWLCLGEEPSGDEPLAKSGVSTGSTRSKQARKAAGWPSGKRHESLSSLLLARSTLGSNEELDIELVTYLVAIHHGWNRPFLAEEDPDPNPATIEARIEDELVTISSAETLDWAAHTSSFARLNERHSPWGLALIEAVLIQADWLVSEEEQSTIPKETR